MAACRKLGNLRYRLNKNRQPAASVRGVALSPNGLLPRVRAHDAHAQRQHVRDIPYCYKEI